MLDAKLKAYKLFEEYLQSVIEAMAEGILIYICFCFFQLKKKKLLLLYLKIHCLFIYFYI